MASRSEQLEPISGGEVGETLPAVIPEGGEVAVSVQPEGLLVAGDRSEITVYIEQIRGVAGRAIDVVGVDKAMAGNAAGLAAGAAAFLGQSARLVQLHPESVKAIR